MLFKDIHLQGIKSGKITLAFRRWKRISVKIGSLIHTPVGLVEIRGIEIVDEMDITDNDAIQAGFSGRTQLLNAFVYNKEGSIYKITVGYCSADPRIKLREKSELSEQEFVELTRKLDRFDSRSKQGQWTRTVLLAINDNPKLHATGLASLTGFEKEWLKLNIRKLKNLGLTVSHSVGYEISSFGKLFISRVLDEK